MNCSFGLIEPMYIAPGEKKIRSKTERYEAISERSLHFLSEYYPDRRKKNEQSV